MSLNKVLNRPMFRQKALKKGALKLIRAQSGTYTGTTLPSTEVIKPKFGRTKAFLKEAVSIPVNLGFYGGGKVADAFGIEKGFNIPRLGLETLGAIGASRALPMLATSAIGLPATAVGLGTIYGIKNRIDAGIALRKKINAMSPEEYEKFKQEQDANAFSYFSDGLTDKDLFGEVKPKPPITNEEIKEEVKISKNAKPGSGLPGSRGGKNVQVDRLTEQDNESDVVKGNVDIEKVVKNNDPNKSPVTIGAEDTVAEKSFKEKPKTDTETKVVTDDKANLNVVKSGSNDLDKPGKLKAADGSEVNNEVITLARQYRKELMAGQKSQAKLVFLANLASGLLSGTTTKGGLGGALEVFGKALGPAVNNYATVKLKENELENEFMSDALELASDEIDARNAVLETPSLDFEKYGVIQFTDKNGRLRNMTGGMLKDGTYVIARPGEIDANGRQVFSPVAAGTFDRFLPGDYATKEQGETLRNLSGKYKALNLGQSTINILMDAEAQGKKFAGPVGRFNLVTTRLGDAMNDLGLSMFGTKEEGERYIEGLKQDFRRDLIADGMTEKEANKFLEENFGSTDSMFKNTLKQLGVFKDQTDSANLERLAINETVLTYALANSLKDKDRLTQKDIQMAKELVNVFPLLRGQKQVIKSLEAVNETILADIKRLENDYQFAFGGDSSTIDKYRIQYGVADPGSNQDFQLENPFSGKSTEELLENF